MHELDAIQLGGIIALSFGIIEVLKIAINKLSERRIANSDIMMTQELRDLIRATAEGTKQLLSMHNAKDEDGRPKWYFPSSVSKALEDVARSLSRMSGAQERMGRTLDLLESRMTGTERTIDNLLTDINKLSNGVSDIKSNVSTIKNRVSKKFSAAD